MSSLGIGRISTHQRFNNIKGSVLENQQSYAEHTQRMNTQQKLINNYDQFGGAKDLVEVTGRLSREESLVENTQRVASEMDLADSVLTNIRKVLQSIKNDATQAGNDTYGPDQLEAFGAQLRNFGENIFNLANTKTGEKYLFGGVQSNIKVITFKDGDLFGNATYKQGQPDLGERSFENLQASVGLRTFLNQNAQSATLSGTAFAPLPSNTQVNITVNDGKQDYVLGNVNLAAGDNVATVVTKINTAFSAAGGTGSIVQNGGGFLQFDTSLITGNIANANASISISKGTGGLPGVLADLGLSVKTVKGISKDIRQTFGELESAYLSGDNARVRSTLVDLQANMSRLIDTNTDLGDLSKKITDADDRHNVLKENYTAEQADIARISAAEAVKNFSAAQTVYTQSLQAGSSVLKLSVFDFLNF